MTPEAHVILKKQWSPKELNICNIKSIFGQVFYKFPRTF